MKNQSILILAIMCGTMFGARAANPCTIRTRCHDLDAITHAKTINQLKMIFKHACHIGLGTGKDLYANRLRQLINHHASKPLGYYDIECMHLKVKTSGPCMSEYRCRRIAAMMRAKNMAQLNRMYRHGCDGYPEQAMHAFRLYQLSKHRVVHPLLHSMPRGISDMAAFSWMMEDGSVETTGDMAFFRNTLAPYDELPINGCRNGSPIINRKYYYKYYKTIFKLSMTHASYISRVFLIANFYGHHYSQEWRDGGPNYLGDNVGDNGMFTRLIRMMENMNPKKFRDALIPESGFVPKCPPIKKVKK